MGTQGTGREMRKWKGISWEFPDSAAPTLHPALLDPPDPCPAAAGFRSRQVRSEFSRLATGSFPARPWAQDAAKPRGFPGDNYLAQLPGIPCLSPWLADPELRTALWLYLKNWEERS